MIVFVVAIAVAFIMFFREVASPEGVSPVSVLGLTVIVVVAVHGIVSEMLAGSAEGEVECAAHKAASWRRRSAWALADPLHLAWALQFTLRARCRGSKGGFLVSFCHIWRHELVANGEVVVIRPGPPPDCEDGS